MGSCISLDNAVETTLTRHGFDVARRRPQRSLAERALHDQYEFDYEGLISSTDPSRDPGRNRNCAQQKKRESRATIVDAADFYSDDDTFVEYRSPRPYRRHYSSPYPRSSAYAVAYVETRRRGGGARFTSYDEEAEEREDATYITRTPRGSY